MQNLHTLIALHEKRQIYNARMRDRETLNGIMVPRETRLVQRFGHNAAAYNALAYSPPNRTHTRTQTQTHTHPQIRTHNTLNTASIERALGAHYCDIEQHVEYTTVCTAMHVGMLSRFRRPRFRRRRRRFAQFTRSYACTETERT